MPNKRMNLTDIPLRSIPVGYPYRSAQSRRFEDGEVFFRYGMGVPVLVRFTDEAEGRKRGAWFGHEPVEKIKLAGHDGEKFIYCTSQDSSVMTG